MRGQVVLVFDVEDESCLTEMQTEVENALYGRVDYEACDSYICPEDGEDWDEDDDIDLTTED